LFATLPHHSKGRASAEVVGEKGMFPGRIRQWQENRQKWHRIVPGVSTGGLFSVSVLDVRCVITAAWAKKGVPPFVW
jgi:hypothetical protein